MWTLSLATLGAAETRPTVTKRSRATKVAPSTPPAAGVRSIAMSQVFGIPRMATKRSITTPAAALTRRMVLTPSTIWRRGAITSRWDLRPGLNLATGSGNIYIGNNGASREDNTIRVGHREPRLQRSSLEFGGSPLAGTSVVVNNNGRLGTVSLLATFQGRHQTHRQSERNYPRAQTGHFPL